MRQAGRILGATADVAKSLSQTNGTILGASANITQIVTETFIGAAHNSLTIASEFWNGIDLFNISVMVREARVVADDGLLLNVFG